MALFPVMTTAVIFNGGQVQLSRKFLKFRVIINVVSVLGDLVCVWTKFYMLLLSIMTICLPRNLYKKLVAGHGF